MTKRQRLGLTALALPIVAGLVWLGVWQVHRLAWKRALIAQVDARLAAAPVAAPGLNRWPTLSAGDAYTRLSVHGRYLAGRTTFTQAVTDLGPGYWVMTPLVSDRGFTLLVNRGFVPQAMKGRPIPAPSGNATVTGLLRLSEPRGGFLRANDPSVDRWYSRDVAAIAAKRRIGPAAPYFIDADAATSPGWPRGGLTVIRFPNNHLQYALTWFAMAAALAGAVGWMALRPPKD
ncbi:SURF1 family protein [Sphingomonas chungangi]|uniref:SURF1 family protein n=1 Tax=Sphingomonas chungangi TaxID=2683589 RepID=UPI0031B5E9A2